MAQGGHHPRLDNTKFLQKIFKRGRLLKPYKTPLVPIYRFLCGDCLFISQCSGKWRSPAAGLGGGGEASSHLPFRQPTALCWRAVTSCDTFGLVPHTLA